MATHYGQLPNIIYNLSIDDFDEMMDFMTWEIEEKNKAQKRANQKAQAQR